MTRQLLFAAATFVAQGFLWGLGLLLGMTVAAKIVMWAFGMPQP
jgi:hypothetical protein